MITVLSWLWQQPSGTRYSALHVNIWAAMVRRNLSMPHRIACVTNDASGIDSGVEIIKPPGDFEDVTSPIWGAERPNCYRRLAMFRPDAERIFGARFVSMDLDCIISRSLDPLFDRSEDIVLWGSPADAPGSGDRPYNGSMLMMTAGGRPQVFERCTPELAVAAGYKFVGSDQAWISECLGPGEATWGEDDGVVWDRQTALSFEERRITFFPGSQKPWRWFEEGRPFARKHYHADRGGRALLLGYGQHVWRDAREAMRAPYSGVIASPEAAAQWPGKVEAVAESDAEAVQIAKLLGFESWTLCGQMEALTA